MSRSGIIKPANFCLEYFMVQCRKNIKIDIQLIFKVSGNIQDKYLLSTN